MTTLRVLFVLLVIGNLFLAAANLGNFSRVPGGEPERLTSQLRPEKLRLVQPPKESGESKPATPEPTVSTPEPQATASPPAASASTPSLACVRWTGLTLLQADQVVQKAKAGGMRATVEATGTPTSWWIYLPPQADRAGAEKKAEELQRLGVKDYFIINESGPNQNSISLGLFKSEDAAKRMLEQLRRQGVQSAQVAPRGANGLKVEVSGPANLITDFSSTTSARLANAQRSNCPAGE
ncbi:MAG: SPOR domain-containing protein [Betaproteobacteria bacterium]|nr:SPOR domain-containing protein [Betaproteobacteria bacterium]